MDESSEGETVSVKRILLEQREQTVRKQFPSDMPEKKRERNMKRKLQENKTLECKLKYYVSTENEKIILQNKMDRVKLFLGEGNINSISNKAALETVLDYYLSCHSKSDSQKENGSGNNQCGSDSESSYQYCTKDQTEEPIFLTTTSSLTKLVSQVQHHDVNCQNRLDIMSVTRLRHAGLFKLECNSKSCHPLTWTSSPYIEGGKFLVNMRVLHGYMMSGLLQVQYERFCKASGIGEINQTFFTTVREEYFTITEQEAKQSMDTALTSEFIATENNEDGIGIQTDARHGWRKNAKDTDVIGLGEITHQCISAVTVTKRDEPCSQKHEIFGTREMYEQFDEQGITIDVHTHDGNSTVDKFVETERQPTKNSQETWHATKGVTRKMKKVTAGTKKTKGIKWHPELADKGGSIRTHVYWSMVNCQRSGETLQKNLLNLVNHYKGNHDQCSGTSRCRRDGNYEPSKTIITSPVAENILANAIKSLKIYKSPERYVYCRSTHYVECFNNALLIYHNKRIVFGTREYRRRTLMSVVEWNENVGRDYTSIHYCESAKNPRRQIGHKILEEKKFTFFVSLWRRLMDRYY